MPKVSVIIPTHNRGASVGSAINSVLGQTEQDFEIIVVDDASTDPTEDVIARFQDSRIRYLRQPAKRGVAAARNRGILNSSGPYVAFLDDDDEWLPQKLAWQLTEFNQEAKDLGLVYGAQETVVPATGHSTVVRLAGDPEAQLRWCRILTSTVMVTRRSIEKVGHFDEELVCGSDYDLWIRLWRAGFQFRGIEQVLARYVVHDQGLTGNVPKKIAAQERILAKHAAFLAEDRASFSEHYRILGLFCLMGGEGQRGRKALGRSVALWPRLANSSYYLCSFLGAGAFRRLQALRAFVRSYGF